MSARFCSSCRRRVWWWQVWMPKSRQCVPCSVVLDEPEPPPTHFVPDYSGAATSPEKLAERISWLYIRGLDDDVCNQLWQGGSEALVAEVEKATSLELQLLNEAWADLQDAKMPPDPFYDLTSCPIAECSIPIRHTHDNDDPRLPLNKLKKEGS